MAQKMENLGMSFSGNFAIWREILTLWIKKYIRNTGKFDHIPRKYAFFELTFFNELRNCGTTESIILN